MLKKYSLQILGLSLCAGLLVACQTPPKSKPTSPTTVNESDISINAQPLKVKTRASSFIYLTPIPKEERTVYISIQNDSGTDAFDIQPWLTQSLQEKSFKVVKNLDEANLVLRANLFRVGKIRGDAAQALLDSEFGNSTELLTLESAPNSSAKPLPNNIAVVLDLQYFDRKESIDPQLAKPRSSMTNLTDLQLLLLCNTYRWERFQTRIVAVEFDSSTSLSEQFSALGQAASNTNADIIRGLS
ncbi:MAG: complement resistance protein TraT [Pseudomonadota bacterium]